MQPLTPAQTVDIERAARQFLRAAKLGAQDQMSSALQDLRLACRAEARGLTKRQAKVLLAIEEYISKHGHAPAVRELQDITGYRSTGSVARILDLLEERGRIVRRRRCARSVEVVKPLTLGDMMEIEGK
ncbi:hypothetical protein ACSHT0_06650 [Tepidicaulis sp. LMO-SS28]|uniref:LexA family protein n=1 Tax=Tepidicaulis sp. LMO-SS28 TaxID=3447455 RepID=UPI003EE1D7E5